MSDIVQEGEDPRAHMKSPLMRESLVSKRVAEQTTAETEWKILPDVNVLYLGGQSIVDRGKSAVFPLLEAVVEARKQHKLILGVGSGARIRHTYHICLELGIPTGGMAMVAGGVDEQNSTMIQCLLAKHKGIVLSKDHMLHLPLWLESGMIPILSAMVAAGVISIPGMMTGQILGGEDPSAAATYQIFILFCISGGVALGTLGVVFGCVRLAFDDRMRLRTDWIRRVE